MRNSVWVVALVSLFVAGCGTVEEIYHPQTVGAVGNGQSLEGLFLKLKAPVDMVQIGKPAVFSITVVNTNDHAVWISKKPQQAFFWTYPNGKHDCYMIDREESRFFKKSDCMQLEPGKELLLPGLVETSYFDRPGITEFLAEVDVPKNTNPEMTPFWSGRLISNGYGLQMIPFKNVSGAR